MHERDERGPQRALLDDPRERAFADLVGAEIEHRAVVALDPHRLDRRDPVGGKRLPRPQRAEQRSASRADGVDARIPVLVSADPGRRERRAVDERDREARIRERGSERLSDETRAGDQNVAIRVGIHALLAHSEASAPPQILLASPCSLTPRPPDRHDGSLQRVGRPPSIARRRELRSLASPCSLIRESR